MMDAHNTPPKWVKTKERLPTKGGYYFVHYEFRKEIVYVDLTRKGWENDEKWRYISEWLDDQYSDKW